MNNKKATKIIGLKRMSLWEIQRLTQGSILCTASGFNDAVIGVQAHTLRIVYSVPKIIKILMERDEMSHEEAVEFFIYNIEGAYVGRRTPLWVAGE